jgi:hypothetical protein
MIEKSKYKEKLLSPHISSSDLKVILHQISWQYALESDLFSRKNSKMEKSTQFLAQIRR